MAAVVEGFKAFYRDLTRVPLDRIESVYTGQVIFRDPVHEIRGADALMAYMGRMCDSLSEGRFEYLDELVGDHSAYIKWLMHFRHPSLGNRLITVRGASHIEFDQRIHFHEDIYDMGEMLYEHVPVAGSITRWLKHRLTK